jgi:hypothetical protein
MDLGYCGHREWADMSDYLIHVAKADDEAQGYYNVMAILGSQRIDALNPFGLARSITGTRAPQHSACFSEIPLGYLDRLAERRSRYGLAFRKQDVIARGGTPVWYVEKSSAVGEALEALRTDASNSGQPDHPFWSLTPFIDRLGEYGGRSYRFEWEREWRVPGGLEFDVAEVAFLLLPEVHHVAARAFFENAFADNTGPAYFCPYLDPNWSIDRIGEAIDGLSPAE